MHLISIIVPAWNESRRILSALERLQDARHYRGALIEILVICNGCTDDTASKARSFRVTNRRCALSVIEIRTRGKGAAVRTGMLAADGFYRIMADCDLATDPAEFYSLVEMARHAPVVIGQRVVKTSPPLRLAMSRIFLFMAHRLVPGLPDVQSGFKLFTWDAARVIFARSRLDGFAFDVEALYIARQMGYNIASVSVPWENDRRSSVRLLDPLYMALDLFRIWVVHHRNGRVLECQPGVQP